MPSKKSKEDTWKESEILGAIRESDKSKRPSGSSRPKESGETSERKQRRDKKERDKEKDDKEEAKEPRKSRKEDERKERDDKGEHRRSRRKEEVGEDKTEKDRTEDTERRNRRKEEEGRREKTLADDRRRPKENDQERHGGESSKERPRRKEKEREDRKSRESKKESQEHGRERKTDSKERDRGKSSDRKSSSKDEKSRSKDEKGKHRETRRDKGDEVRDKERSKKSDKDKGDEVRDKERSKKSDKDKGDEVRDKERSKKSDKPREKEKKHKSGKSKDDKTEKTTERSDPKIKDISSRKKHSDHKKPKDSEQAAEDVIEEETDRKSSITIRKSSILQAEEVNEEEIAEDNYDYGDDDFEDYDDDFEDADEDQEVHDDDDDERDARNALEMSSSELEGVNEIRRAIREENELAESHSSSRSSSRPGTKDERRGLSDSSKVVASSSHGKINFIAAKQKQLSDKVANKTRRRGQELSKMIELDVTAMDFFEMKPINVYELYMKSYGRSNTEQVSVQTNEDDLNQEVQTEDIEVVTKWCQFSNDVQTCGGGDEKATEKNTDNSFVMTGDMRRLNRFLSKASQVFLTLLDETSFKIGQPMSTYKETKTGFSDGFKSFETNHPMIRNRSFMDIQISPVQNNLLLFAYGANEESQLSPDGLLCVWNSNQPTEPQKFLSCQSTPNCCCLSPAKPSFAFAGMEDGSVTLWDLRESYSMHETVKLKDFEFTLRAETFSTAGCSEAENHHSPVVAIVTITSPEDSASALEELRQGTDSIGMSFQIASLEENGTINFWIVIEILDPDLGGSEQDLGLIPGGRVKIEKSGSVIPQIPRNSVSLPMVRSFTATTLQINPNNPHNFTVGTDQGEVLHTSRFGEKLTPWSYHQGWTDCPVIISSIDHCPWKLDFFLVSCTNGTVMLFDSRNGTAVRVWSTFSEGAAIVNVRWSRSKPSVFYALDDRSRVYAWDLLKNQIGPVMKEHLNKNKMRPVQFALTSDLRLLGDNIAKRNPEMVILFSDGSIHVHKLNRSLSEAASDEIDALCVCLEEL